MNDEVRKSEKMTLTKVSEIFKTNGAYVQVAQLDLDGNGEPWFAMYGAMPVELNVQRIFNGSTCSRGTWRSTGSVALVSYTLIIHGVVEEALRNGEATCVGPEHKDADWSKLIW